MTYVTINLILRLSNYILTSDVVSIGIFVRQDRFFCLCFFLTPYGCFEKKYDKKPVSPWAVDCKRE